MPLEMAVERITSPDGTVIAYVKCLGQLQSAESHSFQVKVRVLLAEHPAVVLDLCGITRLDSSGLGALTRLHLSAKHQHKSLKFANLNPLVRDLFSLTRLSELFELFEHFDAPRM
ncbi:MAG: STAS domain-containing protein [Acidobacteriaceae bacterium]